MEDLKQSKSDGEREEKKFKYLSKKDEEKRESYSLQKEPMKLPQCEPLGVSATELPQQA